MKKLLLDTNIRLSSIWFLSLAALFSLVDVKLVLAQPPGTQAARDFVETLNEVILLPLVALLMGVAFLVFLFGAGQYILGANNPTAREQGVKHLTYGIIGLVVMISAWAILNLAAGTFGLTLPS